MGWLWAVGHCRAGETLLVVPVALAGSGSDSPATASGVKKTVKKLKEQVEQLQQQVNALALQPGPQGPEGPQGPQGPAGSFTGTAGGDLTGTYPNPVLRAGAVAGGTGGEVADNTLTNADLAASAQFSGAAAGGGLTGTYPNPTIAQNAVGATQIASGAVRSAEIANGSVAQQDLAPKAFGARAYGHVAADGSLSRSKNVIGVDPFGIDQSIYCITVGGGIDPNSAVVIASPDVFNSSVDPRTSSEFPIAIWHSGDLLGDCPAGSLVVRTFVYDGDETDDDDGGGNEVGDQVDESPEPFSFVVP